jgi:hypothetical protein
VKNANQEVEIRTAVTLADVLNQGQQQLIAVMRSDYFSRRENDAVDAMAERIYMVERVAESRITGIALLPDDRRAIDEAVYKKPFFVTPPSRVRESGMAFYTEAATGYDLTSRISDERADSERASEQPNPELSQLSERKARYSAIPIYLFDLMVIEGFLWHATHSEDEVRCCALCGKFFVARYRKRARFCSDECRKAFLSLSNEPGDSNGLGSVIRCVLSDHDVPVQTYSGLIRNEFGRLKMAGYLDGVDAEYAKGLKVDDDDQWTCAACVQRHFPSWRSYVVPVLKIQERAAS